MEPVLQWGLEVIRALQQIQHPLLNAVFLVVTSLGSGIFFLFVLPLLFWCVDYTLGLRVTVLCSVSAFCNFSLKDLFAQPRPFDLDPSVALTTARGYGLPSGHSQGSLVLWGSIAEWVKRRWFWVVTITLVILIGFSRVYLGVHFPSDVVAGWFLGCAFLILYSIFYPRVETWIAGKTSGVHLLLLLGLLLGLMLLSFNRVMVYQLGIVLGVGVGAIVKVQYFSFSVSGMSWRSPVRYLAGIVILLVCFVLLRNVYPPRDTSGYYTIAFVHSALNGLWISLGAPWLFRVLKL
ncbi:MAG: phosphatase PAP2 family protein [Thermodesulfobacteriota bacterium]|nr:phosphatase PAP2 family protein [Thermodesulfobacteriota bacterium]